MSEQPIKTTVYRVCCAYQNGYWHGVEKDGMANPFPPHGEEFEAYQIGYDEGEGRSTLCANSCTCTDEYCMYLNGGDSSYEHKCKHDKARKAGTLAKHQPCGCVLCTCDRDKPCHGCGAKHCGTHPILEIPNQVFVNTGESR